MFCIPKAWTRLPGKQAIHSISMDLGIKYSDKGADGRRGESERERKREEWG